jgi:hypothetical protein
MNCGSYCLETKLRRAEAAPSLEHSPPTELCGNLALYSYKFRGGST